MSVLASRLRARKRRRSKAPAVAGPMACGGRLTWFVPLLRVARRPLLPFLLLTQGVSVSTLALAGCHGDIEKRARPVGRASAVITTPANAIGKLTGIANGHARSTFEYDHRGRQAREHR